MRVERRLEVLLAAKAPKIDRLRHHAILAGGGEPNGFRVVRQDNRDFSGIIGSPRRLDQRSHVRAAARNQDRRPHTPRHSDRRPRVSTRAPSRTTSRPIKAGERPWAASAFPTSSSRSAEAKTAMPNPQLNVRSISSSEILPIAASHEKTG